MISHTRWSQFDSRCYFPAPRTRSERQTTACLHSPSGTTAVCHHPTSRHTCRNHHVCTGATAHRYILKEKDTPSPCCCFCVASCPRMSVDVLGTSWDQRVSMVQYSFTSTETIRLIRTESPGRPPRLSHSSWTLTLPSPVSKHGA